jgi:hypothetical protein
MLYIKPTDEVLASIDTYEDLYELLPRSTTSHISAEHLKAHVDEYKKTLIKLFPDKTIAEIMSMIDNYNQVEEKLSSLYDYTHGSCYLTVIDFELRKNLTRQ